MRGCRHIRPAVRVLRLPLCCCLALLLTACGSKKSALIDRAIDRAEVKLGLSVGRSDYFPLYLEVADWLGTPYRLGGTTRQGIDCSGFVGAVYQNVYHKKLHRTVADIYKLDCKRVGKRGVKQGDLLFFTNSSRYNKTGVERIGHVALYLGDNYILHTASDYAVIEQISSTRWGYYIEARRVY